MTNEEIAAALKRCRITYVMRDDNGKVAGRIGPFTVRRSHSYYWIIEGPTPLGLAEQLYADPIGRTDIRVNGDGNAYPPRQGATWRNAAGRKVLGMNQLDEIQKYMRGSSKLMHESAIRVMAEFDFSYDPSRFAGTVDLYHIDSEAGLRLWADGIYACRLATPVMDHIVRTADMCLALKGEFAYRGQVVRTTDGGYAVGDQTYKTVEEALCDIDKAAEES